MIPLITQHTDELAEICRRHHVKRLEVFGSAATGDFNPDTSDIDFLINNQTFLACEKVDAYFRLLDDLPRIFDRRDDLVVARAFQNRYFRRNIDKSNVAFYQR